MCHLPLPLLCQVEVGKRWTFECGASSGSLFREKPSLNLRYISPRFRWSNEELTEEQELNAEKFKNSRVMMELIYRPPLNALCMSFNMQSRLLRSRWLSLDLYGGLKFFPVPGRDFIGISYLKGGREIWYMNLGLLCQLDLGPVAPFADIGGDGIITIGTEVKVRTYHKKPNSRYKLKTKRAR